MRQAHLRLVKETDNKLRWDTKIGDAQFEFYIPRWRVPDPYPLGIYVHIEENIEQAMQWLEELQGQHPVRQDPNQPIIAIVRRYSTHTRTVRFDPVGDQKSWQIGSPYIPYELLEDKNTELLFLRITWDHTSE